MALSADAIEHHTSQLHVGVEITKSAHEGGERSRLAAGIHHQNHWQIQVFGYGGAASFAR